MPKSSTSSKSLAFSFDAENRAAQQVAEKYSAAQITLIDKETKLAVRQIITRSIRDGIPPRDAAKLIRNVVGMTRPQKNAYDAYYEKLEKGTYNTQKRKNWTRRSLKSREASKDALRRKYIRRRAIMIARTEVIDALNTGAEASWLQAQKQGLLGENAGKEWVATPSGACSVCQALNGTVVLLGKTFKSPVGALSRPTAHPNCRCAVAPAEAKLDAAIAPDRVKVKVRKKSTRKGLKAEGKVAVKAGRVNADGELIRGSDARAAILKYVDDASAPNRARIIKLQKEYDKLKAKEGRLSYNILDLKEQLNKARNVSADDVLEKFIYNKTRNTNLDVDASFSFGQKVQTKKLKAQRKALDEGVEAWRRMVDDSFYASPAHKSAAKVTVRRERERASANPVGDRNYEVHLVLSDVSRYGKKTTVHELTHTIEFGNGDVLAEAIRWRDLRTKGEKKSWLGNTTGNSRYRRTEVSYTDGWKTLQNTRGVGEVYTGKVYEMSDDRVRKGLMGSRHVNKVRTRRDGWQYATEVTTTGMDQMYNDPAKLARTQPELFDFIYERIIKRKHTNETSKWSLQGSEKLKQTALKDIYEGIPESADRNPLRYYVLEE